MVVVCLNSMSDESISAMSWTQSCSHSVCIESVNVKQARTFNLGADSGNSPNLLLRFCGSLVEAGPYESGTALRGKGILHAINAAPFRAVNCQRYVSWVTVALLRSLLGERGPSSRGPVLRDATGARTIGFPYI